MIKIAIDAMGGDGSPKKVIDGIVLNHQSNGNVFYKIFGDQKKIMQLIDGKIDKEFYEILHTDNVVKSTDSPLEGAKRGKDTSMWLSIDSVKNKETDIVISAGNTGALLVIAKLIFVKNRTNLVNIGDINQNVYFIIEGGFVARSFYFDSQKIAASNFFLNDYFPFMGCIDSFFTGVKTKTELIAVKNSMVLAFHKPAFEKLMAENQDILLLYIQMMTEVLRNETELKTVLIGSSKKDIYGYFP
mgnify:CR=1 FL=1